MALVDEKNTQGKLIDMFLHQSPPKRTPVCSQDLTNTKKENRREVLKLVHFRAKLNK